MKTAKDIVRAFRTGTLVPSVVKFFQDVKQLDTSSLSLPRYGSIRKALKAKLTEESLVHLFERPQEHWCHSLTWLESNPKESVLREDFKFLIRLRIAVIQELEQHGWHLREVRVKTASGAFYPVALSKSDEDAMRRTAHDMRRYRIRSMKVIPCRDFGHSNAFMNRFNAL